MAIFERNETYTHEISFMDDDGALYYPDTVKVTIDSPCGTTVVNGQTMVSNAAGVYQYGYLLPNDSPFGEYSVSVSSEYASATNIDSEAFFLLPWNITSQIRTYSGQTAKKISDDDLALYAWNAYREVFFRVLELHHNERLCCCLGGTCSCCGSMECDCVCGCSSPACTTFKLDNGSLFVASENVVYGCDCDDTDEICVTWVNEDSECSNGKVEVINKECGEIKVYQYDGVTAIPSTNKGIFVTYYTYWESFTTSKFKKAVALLAAYELALLFGLSSKQVSGCDERSRVSFTDRVWNRYQSLIDSISKPIFGGGR